MILFDRRRNKSVGKSAKQLKVRESRRKFQVLVPNVPKVWRTSAFRFARLEWSDQIVNQICSLFIAWGLANKEAITIVLNTTKSFEVESTEVKQRREIFFESSFGVCDFLMTFLYFVNCATLALAPSFIVYKATKLYWVKYFKIYARSEFRARTLCLWGALGYLATQLVK